MRSMRYTSRVEQSEAYYTTILLFSSVSSGVQPTLFYVEYPEWYWQGDRAIMPKVFIVDNPDKADYKVYMVDYASKADEKVYVVDFERHAEKKVFVVDDPQKADKKVFVVEFPSQAD